MANINCCRNSHSCKQLWFLKGNSFFIISSIWFFLFFPHFNCACILAYKSSLFFFFFGPQVQLYPCTHNFILFSLLGRESNNFIIKWGLSRLNSLSFPKYLHHEFHLIAQPWTPCWWPSVEGFGGSRRPTFPGGGVRRKHRLIPFLIFTYFENLFFFFSHERGDQ